MFLTSGPDVPQTSQVRSPFAAGVGAGVVPEPDMSGFGTLATALWSEDLLTPASRAAAATFTFSPAACRSAISFAAASTFGCAGRPAGLEDPSFARLRRAARS